MAISEASVIKMTCQVRLNNGTTSSGSVKTVGVSLGTINPSSWDNDKAYTIMRALSPCLSLSVYALQQVVTNEIVEA